MRISDKTQDKRISERSDNGRNWASRASPGRGETKENDMVWAIFGHVNRSNGLANIIRLRKERLMGDEGGEDQGLDGSTMLHGGQERRQKQSTGTHMIELDGG